MPVAMQIRDVPEDVRDVLAERAAERGQSVQAYLLEIVMREAKLLRNGRAFERTTARRVSIPPDLDAETIIREGRDAGFEVDRVDGGHSR
jgi:plasmid stability protein